jgi:hypothetical protein
MPIVSQLREPLTQFLTTGAAREADVAHFPETNDVELLLSALANPQPFLRQDENLRNEALFRQLSEWLANHLFACQRHALANPPPTWAHPLVRRWHEDKATVITLNYDTLVEATAGGSLPGVSPRQLFPLFSPVRPGFESFSLIKLHGSLSWYYSGAPSYYGETFEDVGAWGFWEPTEPMKLEDVQSRAPGMVPLVIPPTTSKSSYFENYVIQALWQRARTSLEVAARIYVMGYSLPTADVQMRSLLGTTCKGKCLVIIDRNPGAQKHYQELLPEVRVEAVDGEDCIAVFSNEYASPSFKPPR